MDDLEGFLLSEISQIVKDKYYVITYMWNLKIKQNRNRFTDTENKLVFTNGEREGGRGTVGVGKSSYYGSVVMDPTGIQEDAGSIPGPDQWVKDLVLP